jgi:maleate isomerase
VTAGARVRLGMLTPSSNTVLEPVTARLLAGIPQASAHFARFRVTEIALSGASDAQFDLAPMLAAAELLADARCDAICWNGTSASWLGVERDRALCAAIEERTGIPATSAVLALLDAFVGAGVKRYGLVTPYVEDVQQAIVAELARHGFACGVERHAGIRVNFDFAAIPPATIAAMIREAAAAGPDAIAVICTNMDGATIAAQLESENGVAVLDSIAVALWGALRLAGVDPAPLREYGRLLGESR